MTTTTKYLLFAGMFLVLAIISLYFCKSKKEKETPFKERLDRVAAVYTKSDGTRELAVMARRLVFALQYDSTKGENIIVRDTIWGRPEHLPLMDSTGKKVLLDSLGKPRINPNTDYIPISKDSVMWKISGVPYDELIKPDIKPLK